MKTAKQKKRATQLDQDRTARRIAKFDGTSQTKSFNFVMQKMKKIRRSNRKREAA